MKYYLAKATKNDVLYEMVTNGVEMHILRHSDPPTYTIKLSDKIPADAFEVSETMYLGAISIIMFAGNGFEPVKNVKNIKELL